MINFQFEAPTGEDMLFFRDVREGQFFVDKDGNLCQKEDEDTYIIIADPTGRPFACSSIDCKAKAEIKMKFPLLEKINF